MLIFGAYLGFWRLAGQCREGPTESQLPSWISRLKQLHFPHGFGTSKCQIHVEKLRFFSFQLFFFWDGETWSCEFWCKNCRLWILLLNDDCHMFLHVCKTTWEPTSFVWSYNPYKWPYKWLTGVVSPHPIPLAGRGPLLQVIPSFSTFTCYCYWWNFPMICRKAIFQPTRSNF